MLSVARRLALLLVASGCAGADERAPERRPAPAAAAAATVEREQRHEASRTHLDRLDVGRPDAPVTVIAFSEYGCHYCDAFEREVRPAVEREFVRAGQVRWRQVPIAAGTTPHARDAAAAVLCAADQGGFAPMHQRLFEQRAAWMRRTNPSARFARYARELGLDVPRFSACQADRATASQVEALLGRSRGLGVRLAPTFLVNGTRVVGYRSEEDFRRLLLDALAAAGHPTE